MFVDKTLEFCDAEDISAAAGTAIAGDVVDLSANAVNPARGQVLYLVIQITTAFVGSGASVNLKLSSSASATITSSPTDHWQSGVLGVAALTLGRKFVIPLPQGTDYNRYLGIIAITSGATTTAGAINAFLTWDVDNWHDYPDAVN